MKSIEELMEQTFKKYGWTDEQQKRFREFVREKMATNRKAYNTISNYLYTLSCIVIHVKKPFSKMTFEDLLPALEKWNKQSPATAHGRKNKLKAFLRWESGNKHDSRAERIKSGNYFSPVTLDDLLTDDEIQLLRETAKPDPMLIAMLDFHLLWGPRPSESVNLRLSNVEVTDEYVIVHIPETKTICRPVPIPLAKASEVKDPKFLDSALNAYMSLRKWLNAHPYDDPKAPLWINRRKRMKHLSVSALRSIFRKLGKDAGLESTLSPYTLRRTAYNRFTIVDRELLCVGFGWKPGSRMATSVYNKLRPQDVLQKLIKNNGQKKRHIHICPECKKENPKDQRFCAWCGAPLVELPASATLEQFHADRKAQKELEELREKMAKVEKMLSDMAKVPGFEQLMEEAAKKHSG